MDEASQKRGVDDQNLIPMMPLAANAISTHGDIHNLSWPLSPAVLLGLCKDREAYETPRWAIEAILDVELTTPLILDPCSGTGIIGQVCREHELTVTEIDIEDWAALIPGHMRPGTAPVIDDFLKTDLDLSRTTVIMNPPFSLAERFVDHAVNSGARKIICFQRQAWRESLTRREWWEENAPARVWVCGSRANCWRFDVLGSKWASSSGTNTSHAWYVWERGHKPAEVTSAIYPVSGIVDGWA
jgi:hypothetical protein